MIEPLMFPLFHKNGNIESKVRHSHFMANGQ